VLPFLGILVAPDKAFKNPIVMELSAALGAISPDQLVLPLSAAFAATALAAGVIRMLWLWVSVRFTFLSGADLSAEVYRRTLYQSYQVHVARNSSEVISTIINKVNGVVFGVLQPLPILISSVVMLIAITIALLFIDATVAITATVFFGSCYGIVAWMSRRQLEQNSQRVANSQTRSVKALQEGLGGVRDVVLDGTQPLYCNVFQQADYPLRRAQGESYFIGVYPRFGMEALGMVVIAGLAYGLSLSPGGVATAFPVLGALALGAQRLLPALQNGFAAWANIASSRAALSDTLELLDQPISEEMLKPASEALAFRDAIRFEAVSFRYAADGPWVLDNINLTIPKGSQVGFVGSTGSGKSTLLDILMGLLTSTRGDVLVDGRPIKGSYTKAWQRNIAHVPQSIYLTDATIAENIAFGLPRDAIDMRRVRQVASQAQIANFIENSQNGYESFVGERGVRLSGGQRQRIGIARALYKQASVLVFDEATSALDNATEQSVMNAIASLSQDLTILLIAHRLTTVRHCDIIVELEHGRVVAQGTYEQLLECSPSFRTMAS
jgi:ATP-binding cassette subfamily B protein